MLTKYRSLWTALERSINKAASVCPSILFRLLFVTRFIMHALLLLFLSSLPLIALAGQCHSRSQNHQKRNVVHPNAVTQSKTFKLVDKYHGSNFFEWAQIAMLNFSTQWLVLISWHQRLEFFRRSRSNTWKHQVLESEGRHGSGSCVYPRWQYDCYGSWW